MTTKLERIGKRAAIVKDTVFNNIGCVIDLDMLRESYRELNGNKAIGIDGVLKQRRCFRLVEEMHYREPYAGKPHVRF